MNSAFVSAIETLPPVVFALNPPGYTRPLVYALTRVSYWAGVAGGGRGFAAVRGRLIFPGRASDTCGLGTNLQLKYRAVCRPPGGPPKKAKKNNPRDSGRETIPPQAI